MAKGNQPAEGAPEREKKEVSRSNKRQACSNAHRDTLALLNDVQSALKQRKQKEESHEKLSEREETYRRELTERVERFKKELSDTQIKSRKEITKLCESWDKGAQQWNVEKRELEENVLVKENIWNYKASERKEEQLHVR